MYLPLWKWPPVVCPSACGVWVYMYFIEFILPKLNRNGRHSHCFSCVSCIVYLRSDISSFVRRSTLLYVPVRQIFPSSSNILHCVSLKVITDPDKPQGTVSTAQTATEEFDNASNGHFNSSSTETSTNTDCNIRDGPIHVILAVGATYRD